LVRPAGAQRFQVGGRRLGDQGGRGAEHVGDRADAPLGRAGERYDIERPVNL
jgi:hypothetical protein